MIKNMKYKFNPEKPTHKHSKNEKVIFKNWKTKINYRLSKIMEILPKNIKTVLDIGSSGNIFRNYNTTTLDLENSNCNQDLNIDQKLKFEDNSFDIIILNQILEHLGYVEELVEESKRVSKRYILVGLPNELIWSNRIKILFNKWGSIGYSRYWHKHFFTIDTIEKFIIDFYKKYEKKTYFYACSGAKFIPYRVRDFLADNFSSLCAKEVYYLIDLKN